MKRGVVFLAAAAALVSQGVATPAGAGSGFDARRDAYQVSDCMQAYKLLEEAALGLTPDAFQPYERAYITSWNRIRPFVHASVRAIGDREFYRHISDAHYTAERLLESKAIESEDVRNALVRSLAAEARACDTVVIGWGPPPIDQPQ